jgi:hypothetical protein
VDYPELQPEQAVTAAQQHPVLVILNFQAVTVRQELWQPQAQAAAAQAQAVTAVMHQELHPELVQPLAAVTVAQAQSVRYRVEAVEVAQPLVAQALQAQEDTLY